jgi:hypothetical protein
MNMVILAPLTTLLLKMWIGTRGSPAPLHCQSTNPALIAKPITSVAMTAADSHGYSPPAHVSAITIKVDPAKARNAPVKSTAWILAFQLPVTGFSGMKKRTPIMLKAISDRLSRKIQRHEC